MTLNATIRAPFLILSLLVGLGIHGVGVAGEEPAGRVITTRGKVTAVVPGGDIVPLKRGDRVYVGQTIATGPNSRARIRFKDEGFIYLRPASRLRIEKYRYTGDKDEDGSLFSLVKGGFRAVTGLIGKQDKDDVEYKTPVATIGIRGTDHEARFCNGDCIDLMNQGVQPPPDGLYNQTLSGATNVGGNTFGPREAGYTDPTGRTIKLPEPPPILTVDNMPDPTAGIDQDDEDAEGDSANKQGGNDADDSASGRGKDQPPGRDNDAAGKRDDSGEPDSRAPQGPDDGPGGPGGNRSTGNGGDAGTARETPPDGGGEGFDIPAKPPAPMAVDCVR